MSHLQISQQQKRYQGPKIGQGLRGYVIRTPQDLQKGLITKFYNQEYPSQQKVVQRQTIIQKLNFDFGRPIFKRTVLFHKKDGSIKMEYGGLSISDIGAKLGIEFQSLPSGKQSQQQQQITQAKILRLLVPLFENLSQIFRVLYVLWDNDIVHGDMTPGNITFDYNTNTFNIIDSEHFETHQQRYDKKDIYAVYNTIIYLFKNFLRTIINNYLDCSTRRKECIEMEKIYGIIIPKLFLLKKKEELLDLAVQWNNYIKQLKEM